MHFLIDNWCIFIQISLQFIPLDQLTINEYDSFGSGNHIDGLEQKGETPLLTQ